MTAVQFAVLGFIIIGIAAILLIVRLRRLSGSGQPQITHDEAVREIDRLLRLKGRQLNCHITTALGRATLENSVYRIKSFEQGLEVIAVPLIEVGCETYVVQHHDLDGECILAKCSVDVRRDEFYVELSDGFVEYYHLNQLDEALLIVTDHIRSWQLVEEPAA